MCGEQFYIYGSTEIEYLSRRDPVLGEAIAKIGPLRRPVIPDLFQALVKSIVGQQISSRAQATIWQRMQGKFLPFTPENIAAVPAQELQSCGIPLRKAAYIQGAARAALAGHLEFSLLETMSDAEVCAHLTQLKGVGTWTAEMLLIFALQRPNVLSFNDLAIRRGLRMLYGHPQITPQLFHKYHRRYSPQGTVASLYLWAIAAGALLELTDPALV